MSKPLEQRAYNFEVRAEETERGHIIANGGVNDYLQNAALGDIPTVPVTDDTADANLDLSTVCGGAQHLFYNMIKKYPDT